MNENIHPVSNNIFLDYMLLFKYEYMRVILIFSLFCILALNVMSKSHSSPERCDSVITVIDSLAFNYPVERISFMLDGKLVHHSVIFKEGRQLYKFANGFMDPLDAIKHFGEKYRNGLLMYKKEESDESK